MQRNYLFVFITCFIHIVLGQYDRGKILLVNSSKPTAIRIIPQGEDSNQLAIIGFRTGQIQIVDLKQGKVLQKLVYLNEPITSIQINSDKGFIYLMGKNQVVQLDREYNQVQRWFSPQILVGMSAVTNLTGVPHLIFYSEYFIRERVCPEYLNQTFLDYEQRPYDGGFKGINHAKYSPNHRYFYYVTDKSKQLTIKDLDYKQIANRTYYELLYPYHKDKVPRKDNSTNRNVTTLDLPRIIIGDKRKTFKFHMQIKNLYVDYKDKNAAQDEMIMLTSQNSLLHTKMGVISSYIPYKNNEEDIFVDLTFCQNTFFVTVQKQINHDNIAKYFLTLWFKSTLLAFKTINLNEQFQTFSDIVRADCNANLIVLQTNKNELLILEGYEVFSFSKYLQIQTIQVSISIIFILCMVCICCRRSPKQKEQTIEENDKKPQEQAPSSTSVEQTQSRNQQVDNSVAQKQSKQKRKGKKSKHQ